MTTTDLTTLSGLDLMRWVQSERPADIPTIGRLLGMRFDEVDPGRVVVSLDTRPDFANPLGTVHGGIAATLLDSAMGCAVHTTLPAGLPIPEATSGQLMVWPEPAPAPPPCSCPPWSAP
ncbi:PaaI family thioesterase, partial [Streptomyces asiaticus]